jgi:hypothetical protein
MILIRPGLAAEEKEWVVSTMRNPHCFLWRFEEEQSLVTHHYLRQCLAEDEFEGLGGIAKEVESCLQSYTADHPKADYSVGLSIFVPSRCNNDVDFVARLEKCWCEMTFKDGELAEVLKMDMLKKSSGESMSLAIAGLT